MKIILDFLSINATQTDIFVPSYSKNINSELKSEE